LVTVVVCLAVAEVATRLLDQKTITSLRLAPEYGGGLGQNTTPQQLDNVTRSKSVAREWFFTHPPPLPNKHPVPAEWVELNRQMEAKGRLASGFRPEDLFKAWNSELVGDPCSKDFFADVPGRLWLFDPPKGEKNPPFRFLPDATTPAGLVTNQFGWRGKPVEFARTPKTIRIVFVGASTTAGAHSFVYSLPELIGHWLNLWAAANRPDIRFEVMMAARESLNSQSIAAVVRQEVAPLRPDLVVYYEGGNQFSLDKLIDISPEAHRPRPKEPDAVTVWLQKASRYSMIARRVQALMGFEGMSEGGRELARPDHSLHWPKGLDEKDPDLSYPDLPVSLNTIMRDLDQMRGDLAAVDGELAVSSFIWMVKDGMVLNPIRNKVLWEDLNIRYYPWRYRDIERLATFQNRVLAKYAAQHGLPFFDMAGRMPFDPDLFADALHETWHGMRLKAWVVLQELVPIIEQRLASGAWPKPVSAMGDTHPAFAAKPREIAVNCGPEKKREAGLGVKP
jgi:hypothetical protein